MRIREAFIAAVFLAATSAHAATFNYTGQVTSNTINSGGGTSFGTAGDAVMATFEVTAMPGEAIPVGPVSGGQIDISVSSPDFSYGISFSPEGFNNGFNSSISVSTTSVFFATSSGSFNWPNFDGSTLRTTFQVSFGAALPAAPATYDELIAALNGPGSTATFITNGDFLFNVQPGQAFDEYAASFTPATTVPVPMAGALLFSGLALTGIARRRRSTA